MVAEPLPTLPYVARARVELADLEARAVLSRGSVFAQVLLLKGEPGPAERAGEGLLAGPDGTALAAAFTRLGYLERDLAAAATFCADDAQKPLDPAVVALVVETFDPELVVALDDAAAAALHDAWDLPSPLEPGRLCAQRGRRALALGGFEAALAEPQAKQVMWARIKQVPPLGAPL